MLFYGLIIKEENDCDHRKAQKKFELSGQRSKNSTNAQNNSENKNKINGHDWYLVHIHSNHGMFLTWYDNNSVTSDDCRRQ